MCTTCVSGAHKDQKSVLNPQELVIALCVQRIKPVSSRAVISVLSHELSSLKPLKHYFHFIMCGGGGGYTYMYTYLSAHVEVRGNLVRISFLLPYGF